MRTVVQTSRATLARVVAMAAAVAWLHAATAGPPPAAAEPTTPAESAAGTFDYLYVESNEGQSSGGHAAIRFADDVYDFTHEDRGLLRLRRQRAGDFLYAYAFLQNRPIHVVRVQEETSRVESMREAFAARYLAEQAQFDARDAARADEELLRAIASARTPVRIVVEAAGYFQAAAAATRVERSGRLLALRRRLERTYGDDFVRTGLDRARAAIAAADPHDAAAPALPDAPDRLPVAGAGFAERLHDAVAELVALQVLASAAPLAADSVRTLSAADLPLSSIDRLGLLLLRERLEDRLARLFGSTREDKGVPLLIGMARLLAIERSIRSGVLAVPDLVRDGGVQLSRKQVARSREWLAVARGEARDDLASAMHALGAAEAGDEIAWGRVETAAVRASELDGALESGAPIRMIDEEALPARSATVEVTGLGPTVLLDAAAAAEAAAESGRTLERRLRDLHSYDLVTRNCASELLAQMARGLEASDPSPRVRSTAATLDSGAGMSFVPFASARLVVRQWPAAQRLRIPSYRESRLLCSRGRDGAFTTAWRESNTLTSRWYRPSTRDSAFLFFADALALRPLAGIANLVAGAGASAFGLVTAPLRGTDTLVAGLRGMLFSVPELGFVRIRRGSYDFLDRREVSTPAGWNAGVSDPPASPAACLSGSPPAS